MTTEDQPAPVHPELRRVALVVFDMGEAHLYGRGSDGRIDYSDSLPWPADWPPYITGRWLRDRGIPFSAA